jgi:type IV pilus assembly protein PilV
MTARAAPGSAGFTLLEALVAIVILSVGVIGLVGLQTASVKNATEARYRSEAAMLVNQLIGRMWATDRTVATLQANFNTGGSAYGTWLAEVQSTLPGVGDAGTATAPAVVVDDTSLVTVTVYWLAPSDASSTSPHNFTTVAQIR